MVTAKWCNGRINSGDIRFKNVLSEVMEVFEADNVCEIKEEMGDVLYFFYCWLYNRFRINLPMLGAMSSVRKYINRLDVWEAIFEQNDLEFSPKYLVNGSNYEKPFKVYLAITLAKREQNISKGDVG